MPITLEQAKNLGYGDMIHDPSQQNSDGTPVRFRVTGKPKVWKTRPGHVKVPIKHGMYESGYLISKGVDTMTISSGWVYLEDMNLGDGLE